MCNTFLKNSCAYVDKFDFYLRILGKSSNFAGTFAKQEIMNIKTTELLRSSQTWDGAALPAYPSEHPELIVCRTEFPMGAKTGWHHHTVINYGIVEQGELTIVCQDGTERTFHEGEAIVEVVGTIHRGENRGQKPVVLDMFYVSAAGVEITIQHPELSAEHKMPKPEKMETTGAVNRVDARVRKLVMAVGEKVLPRRQIIAELGLKQKSRRNFADNYMRPAYEKGYIDFAYPSAPNKPEQAYRLTVDGLDLYKRLTNKEEQ